MEVFFLFVGMPGVNACMFMMNMSCVPIYCYRHLLALPSTRPYNMSVS